VPWSLTQKNKNNKLHSNVKMKRMLYIWKYTAHEWLWNYDTWILHPFLWISCSIRIICNFVCANCLNKVLILFKVHPCTLWGEPHPHAKTPMMPNKISKAKCTDKGCLTCSICCA
jgi:hypothetical protein